MSTLVMVSKSPLVETIEHLQISIMFLTQAYKTVAHCVCAGHNTEPSGAMAFCHEDTQMVTAYIFPKKHYKESS